MEPRSSSTSMVTCRGMKNVLLQLCVCPALFCDRMAPLPLPLDHPLVVAGFWDFMATCITFAVSVLCDNSSIYDPYWSVAPLPITIYFAYNAQNTANVGRALLICLAVWIWGLRLTWNMVKRELFFLSLVCLSFAC